MNCIFCSICDHSLPAEILLENEEILAFRDVHPQTPDHILIIPKKHIASLNETQDDESLLLGKLLRTTTMIAKELGHASNGYRVVINTGSNGGQTVHHLHVHLLAGKVMTWPPG